MIVAMILFGINMSYGQETTEEVLTIPLSSPGQPGKLKVKVHDGSVTVQGYSGSDISVTVISHPQDDDDDDDGHHRAGLKRIPNQNLDVSITEENNQVTVSGRHSRRNDFVIQVPARFDLSVNTHHNGEIMVSNINGEIELNAHHEGITVTDASGSVVAGTHHGDIQVAINSVNGEKPMAFSTYHGDVEVTFPSNMNGEAKIKTKSGDIYTDFDIDMKKQQPVKSEKDGKKEIKLSGWTHGTIGSGGPEIMFTSYHGDIIIRKG